MKNLHVEHGIHTTVIIENKFEYKVILDLELTPLNDYSVKIEFENTSLEDVEILNDLFNKPKALAINCAFFNENDYKINYIVIEKAEINNNATSVIWHCLSDEPINLEIR